MNRQYYTLFRTKTLNHKNLEQKILQKYPTTPPNKPFNFDQLLYVLDQGSNGRKCDRDIAGELFNQVKNQYHKASLSDMIKIYIENLQTSKLCLKRDEAKLLQIQSNPKKYQQREKSFIFIKLIQASIYSRFTKESVLEYRIMPTDIPPIALHNTINPVLNHEFILEMEEPTFDLIFYESGIEIFRWTFPDQPDLAQGQYEKVIRSQNVAFQAMIKYVPKGRQKSQLIQQKESSSLQKQIDRQQSVFKNLCLFQPFLQRNWSYGINSGQNDGCLFKCFPFLRPHVRNLYWLTIIVLIVQMWASSLWPIEFLDIMVCFYLIGLLTDLQIKDYSMRLLILQLIMGLMSVKSIWGAVSEPYFSKTVVDRGLIIFCIALKILLILLISVTRNRENEIESQRNIYLFGQKENKKEESIPEIEYNIWEDI